MSHQIQQTIAEAAAKNMSVAATLEWLADMELEARTGRAIDRRFKSSRLQTFAIIRKRRFLNFGRRGLGGMAKLESKIVQVASWERLLLKLGDDGLKVAERANG